MALRSKNFLFRRKSKDGLERDYQDSDTFTEASQDYRWNEVSLPLAAGGYYGATTGLHTLAFTLRNFIGRIYVQATLASNPKEEDWFPIKFAESCNYFIEFHDRTIFNPNNDQMIVEHGTTGTFAENVIGNFTYLRIGIDRSYISEDPSLLQKRMAGKIEEVLINY